ncbi:MAG: hypothetical protein ACREIU_05505 [Planctomycetota bacterium]
MNLGHGIVTPGVVDVTDAGAHAAKYGLPEDLAGKSVVDLGSADGFFAFEAERRGATRVLSVDGDSYRNCEFGPTGYRRAYLESSVFGHAPEHLRERISALTRQEREDILSRHEAIDLSLNFALAKEVLGSKVERRRLNLAIVRAEDLGAFDIVLCLGVIYHLRNPLALLDVVGAITRELAIVQSQRWEDEFPNEKVDPEIPVARFVEGTECHGDMTYWWLPNGPCLEKMVRSAGFPRVVRHSSTVLHAYKAI